MLKCVKPSLPSTEAATVLGRALPNDKVESHRRLPSRDDQDGAAAESRRCNAGSLAMLGNAETGMRHRYGRWRKRTPDPLPSGSRRAGQAGRKGRYGLRPLPTDRRPQLPRSG